jgi:adenine deaminase
LRQCAQLNQQPVSVFDERRDNPRAVKSAPPILIKNANLIDGDGSVINDVSVLLADGVIKQIAHDIDAPEDAKIIQAGGRYVSPGLVDMVDTLRTTDK